MALKGPLWLLGKCLEEERKRTKLKALASRVLDLGLLRSESTRGHVLQASGAVQKFLISHRHHIRTIKASSARRPFKPTGQILDDWKSFLRKNSGSYGRADFRYNYTTLKGYLTPKYAGKRVGGGGGNNEFELAMRLIAEYPV